MRVDVNINIHTPYVVAAFIYRRSHRCLCRHHRTALIFSLHRHLHRYHLPLPPTLTPKLVPPCTLSGVSTARSSVLVSSLLRNIVPFNLPVSQSSFFLLTQFLSFLKEDVRRVLSFSDPDRIVLELCEARFSSLRKSILRTSPEKKLSLHLSGTDENRKGRTFKEIARTFRGAPQAILALLLDGAYKLQVLSGLDPGQEFANPIRNYPVAKLVCGDDPASTTVNRMYRVFISPLTSMRVSVDAFTAMFRRVVLPPKGGINLFRVLLEPMRLQELGRLLLAASAVGMVLFAFGSATAVAIDATPFVVPQNFHSALSTVDLAVQSATSLYLLVSILHFLKVLIIDRDVVLADSIRSAMTKSENEKQQAVKICVVVGLLHVNGVLQELNEGACSTSEPGQP